MRGGGCPRAANFFKKVFYRNRVPYEKLIYPDPTIFVRVVFFHIIMAPEYRRPAYHQSSTIPVLLPYPGTITVPGHVSDQLHAPVGADYSCRFLLNIRVEQSVRTGRGTSTCGCTTSACLLHVLVVPFF